MTDRHTIKRSPKQDIKMLPAEPTGSTLRACGITTSKEAARKLLFVYDLDLLIDYLPGKPVDRHVHPVMLLAFDEEARKSGSVGRIAAALGYYVNQQVPCASLARI